MRAHLPLQFEKISKAAGRDQSDLCTLLLNKRVGGNGGAMLQALQGVLVQSRLPADRIDPVDDRALGLRGIEGSL